MNVSPAGAFVMAALFVAVAAWGPRGQRARAFAKMLQFASIGKFYPTVLVTTLVAYVAASFRSPQFLPALFSLAEVAGVIYLAREVYWAQTLESLHHRLGRLVDLEPLAKASRHAEYFDEYFRIDGGKPRFTAAYLASVGALAGEVNELVKVTKAKFDDVSGQTFDLTVRERRRLLAVGITFVLLALVGHGAEAAMTNHAEKNGITDEQYENLSDEARGLKRTLAEHNDRLNTIERQSAMQAEDIGAIKTENRRWHVARPKAAVPKREPDAECRCVK